MFQGVGTQSVLDVNSAPNSATTLNKANGARADTTHWSYIGGQGELGFFCSIPQKTDSL